MRWIGYVATILWWSGIARSLSTLNRGHSYKISPKPCRVPGLEGNEGTCMFVWECIKSEGTHVGVCVDTFMFGSCCVHNNTANAINAPHHQHSHPAAANTHRPTLAEALGSDTARPTLTSLSSIPLVEHTTSSPGYHYSHGAHAPTEGATRNKPHVTGLSRPLQKRPHAKPTSDHEDRLQTSAVPSVDFWKDKPQGTKRPDHHEVASPQQKTRPVEASQTASKKNTSVSGFTGHQGHQTLKDKVAGGHNTLVIRLPGKEHTVSVQEAIRPGRPSNQRPFGSRPDDGKTEDSDLSVQETIHRPNVNSVDENEAVKQTHTNANFIHTERPQWATRPVSIKPSTDFSKPYFSIKTTTTRPISISSHTEIRPNFVSKPESSSTVAKTSTTSKPSYTDGQLITSAAGSVPQTSHWQVTTEPAFITKQKPSSSTRPVTSFETTRPLGSSSHFWTDNSWKPPRPSLKPHWTDNPSLLHNGPEAFPPRPSFKPTEPQESMEFHKPLGSAHYITTSHFETSARPRPTKKTTTTSTTSTTIPTTTSTMTMTTSSPSTSTSMSTSTGTSTSTSTSMSTSTSKSTSTGTSMSITASTSTSTTVKPSTTSSTTQPKTGSVMTVSASSESKGMQCGVPPLFPRPETRIVGGKDAPFGRWPWQVSVRRTSFFGFSSTHRCGGAVLNENWIATAGHCVDDLLTSQIRIRVGEYDFSSVQERLPYVERGVAKKVVHPKYNFFTYEYDLALVRLESSLTFAPHISPICLPATDDLLIGENATVTGWGRLSEGGTLPSVLQEVSVPIVSNDRCKSMFLRAGRHEFIPDIFLCAGYETGGQDSCQGDSGGPLQVRGKDGRYFLAGIISWGIGCAEANLPGVCTRISKFVPWILKNVT